MYRIKVNDFDKNYIGFWIRDTYFIVRQVNTNLIQIKA